jgi:hypothetical protein
MAEHVFLVQASAKHQRFEHSTQVCSPNLDNSPLIRIHASLMFPDILVSFYWTKAIEETRSSQ